MTSGTTPLSVSPPLPTAAAAASVSRNPHSARRQPAARVLRDHCGNIEYDNPKMVLGTLPVWEDKVLLCRRAIEPRYGLWTLPAGFMENNETTAEAAQT